MAETLGFIKIMIVKKVMIIKVVLFEGTQDESDQIVRKNEFTK